MNAQHVMHNQPEIEIYTKEQCPYCVQTKAWFTEHGFTYTENKLYGEEEMMAFLQRTNGARTVPQIFVDGKCIGSYQDLMKIKHQLIKKTSGGLLESSKAYKPFYYPWAVEITTRHEKAHWIEDEIDLGEDVTDWKNGRVSTVEKEFITNILRLFTQSDVAVGQNYYEYYIPKFKNNEIRNMLGSFAAREGIHQRAYALLNETLGLPDSEYHAFLEYKEMTDKVDFMTESDTSTQRGLGLALAKTVFNEGVALFASFVMLLNFQRFGKMKGMGKVVEWSIRDESMHVEGNARLFKQFCAEHNRIIDEDFKKEIYKMSRKAVKLEDKFIELAYDFGEIQGLPKEEVKEYVRYITDRRLLQLGLKPNYGVKDNPLKWLEWVLNGADHTNFFENRVTEYEVAGLSGDWNQAYA
jgi:ribonucleotide reductase beta subunit family protein with ferritin-like domain/glutaredoxin